ncbi:alginate lyase family protein [Granulosicoccaceae sp. 1_MG-2023]|nr:alginate lyase family protein [Granulosicoccaceae sp. 1_MG-2023]
MPSKAFLYAHAMVSLRPSQILWYLLRRGLKVGEGCSTETDFAPVPAGQQPHSAFLTYPMGAAAPDGFCFLNREKRFDGGIPRWQNPDMPRLWSYNLHYFDYLQDPALPVARKQAIIEDWIAENPQGTVTAWEPYTASLRIVNWIKFLTQEPAAAGTPVLTSLAGQGRWMRHNLELHILANHFFKNIKALLFAGCYFGHGEALEWFQRGCRDLSRELDEQQLSDGGHYERSPMYHAIFLEDLLDILNYCGPALADPLRRKLQRAAVSAAVFLRDLRHPNGDFPLFNDAAFGIAPDTQQLLAYAQDLLGDALSGQHEVRTAFAESGYFLLGNEQGRMIIDCGETGPRYQPGHTHCDTLSYELSIGGQTVVVDTGTLNYEPGDARKHDRSTAAHNTVVVDGQEQSEVWGLFRVARRASPTMVRFDADSRHAHFCGSHDGYRRLKQAVTHQREVSFDGHSWTLSDLLSGEGEHTLDSYIHFHPALTASLSADEVTLQDGQGRPVARLHITGPADVMLEPSVYHPRFGIEQANQRLHLHYRGPLPATLGYRITPATGN